MDHFRYTQHVMASEAILKAKILEFEAAMYLGVRVRIEEARNAIHAATEAHLDARLAQFEAVTAELRGR